MFELNDETRVAFEIYKHNQQNELIYYSKLVELFNSTIDAHRLGIVLDKLFDLCIVDAKWTTTNDNRWVRAIRITKEYIPYCESLATVMHKE
jgi:hypothetical protein